MSNKISENTELTLDLKTLIIIVAFVVTVVGMWFALQKDIDLAKELPKPEVSRTEKYVLLEINSEWNLRNSARIDKVKNVEHRIAYLEEQTPAFKKKIRSVPIAILYKDNNKIAQWNADISFKLVITEEEIKKAIKENE